MAASISTKKKSVASDFLRRSASLLSGAAGQYFSEAMPVTSSIISDAKDEVMDISAKIGGSKRVMPNLRAIKSHITMRNIYSWFMGQEEETSEENDIGDFLDYDTDTEDDKSSGAVFAKKQFSESAKHANQISNAIIGSIHHEVESMAFMTSEIKSSIEEQTSVIASGFDSTNERLDKILEVLTKNTSTLIETTVAGFNQMSENDKMLSSGKFNFGSYKRMVQENIKNNPVVGLVGAFLPYLTDKDSRKSMFGPEELVKTLFNGVLNKAAPNAKKNMQALDEAVNNVLMGSLIRLGNQGGWGIKGQLGRIFGLTSNRREYGNNEKGKLELKATAFDTQTREAIVSAIPGYLREILKALNGKDVIYDYRSRSFKTQRAINKEFRSQSTMRNTVYNSSRDVRRAFGNGDAYGSVLYDVMMMDLGSMNPNQRRAILNSFGGENGFYNYMMDAMSRYGGKVNNNTKKVFSNISRNLSSNGMNAVNIGNQVAMNNFQRNQRMKALSDEYDAYGMQITKSTNNRSDIRRRLGENGLLDGSDQKITGPKMNGENLTGLNYTNKALFEIYRLLNRGINVFQVGTAKHGRTTQYEDWVKARMLVAPKGIQVRTANPGGGSGGGPSLLDSLNPDNYDENGNPIPRSNPLRNGEGEDLTKGQRFGRWAKQRGGALANAVIHGDTTDVVAAFNDALADVVDITGSKIKEGASNINKAFGNVTGWINYKLFGKGYTYFDENGKEVQVKDIKINDKSGGVFGFVRDYFADSFKGAKDSAKKWFDTVAGYFDYGDKSNDKDEQKVAGKRKKLIATSVGAMAGAGILGGPLGIIMGAVAGNALGQVPDLGKKIKEVLFGRDEKGKAKGLITKLSDAVIDPIKFTIGKTFSRFGDLLKKNVLGPISDIGVAIKERAVTAANNTFGKAFKFIGKAITAPFRGIGKLLLKVLHIPIRAAGAFSRGAATVGSGVFGGLTEMVAKGIGSGGTHVEYDEEGNRVEMSTNDYINQRKAARNAEIKNSSNRKKYKNYKQWQEAEHARNAEWGSKFDEYTNGAKVSENANVPSVGNDVGAHKRLDEIINILKQKFGVKGGNTPLRQAVEERNQKQDRQLALEVKDDDAFGNNAIVAASVLVTEGDITTNDQRLANQIFTEASKPNSNDSVIHSKLRDLLQSQKEKFMKGGSEEKKESLIDKLIDKFTGDGEGSILDTLKGILDFIKNHWPGLLAALAAMLAMMKKDNNVKHNIQNALGQIADAATSKDPVTNGVNAFMNLFDTEVEDKWDIANPFATLYHADNDAGNHKIKNAAATHAKRNWQFTSPLVQSFMKPAWQQTLGYINNRMSDRMIGKSRQYADMAGDAFETSMRYMPKQPASTTEIVPYTGGSTVANEIVPYGYDFGADLPGPDEAEFRRYQDQGSQYWNQSERYSSRAEKYRDRAKRHDAKAAEMTSSGRGSSLAKGIGEGFARVGMMTGISKGVGGIAGGIANHVFGMDEEQSQQIGNVTTATTTAGLMVNQLSSEIKTMHGKQSKSIIDRALGGIKNIFNYAANSLGKSGTLSKWAGKISKFFDDIYDKTVGKITGEVAQKVAAKIGVAAGSATAEQAAGVATLGIGIAAAGVGGAIHGATSVANLFRVDEKDVDGIMKGLSPTLNALWSALEWVPYVGYGMAVLDILDAFVFQGILGTGIKQYIADFLYNLIKGDDGKHLKQLQQGFVDLKEEYQDEFGVELPTSTFNDLYNTTGFFDRIWRGKSGGWDEGGGRINTGLQSKLFGQDTVYMRDEDGNLIKNKEGRNIEAVDMYGNTMKRDKKLGDKVSSWWNKTKRWWVGGDVYQTDANGQAMVDENGDYMVGGKDLGIIQKIGRAAKNAFLTVGKNIGQLFSYIKDGDIKALWTSDVSLPDDKESGMISTLAGGLYTGGKIVATIPTLSSAMGHAVKKIFGTMVEKVKGTIQTVQEEREYANTLLHDKSSSFFDIFKVDETDDEDNPIGGFGKAIIIASRLSIIPTNLIKRIGQGIAKVVGEQFQKVSHAWDVLSTNTEQLGAAAKAGDFGDLCAASFENDEENPVGGFTQGLFYVAKGFMFLPTGISWIGHRIADLMKAFGRAGHSLEVLSKNHEALAEAANAGDIEALNGVEFQNDEEDPVGGFTKGLFTVDKGLSYVSAGFHWLGNKIGGFFGSIAKKINAFWSPLQSTHEQIAEAAQEGDYAKLGAVELKDDEGNPLSGFAKGLIFADRLVHYVPCTIHWLGNKISEKWNNSSSGGNFDALKSSMDIMSNAAKEGDVKGVAGATIKLGDKFDPLYGIWGAVFGISKIFNIISALVHMLGSKIGEGWDWIKDKTSGLVEGAKNGLEGFWDWLGGGTGGPDDSTASKDKAAKQTNLSSESTGDKTSSTFKGELKHGNPLDKPFVITSGYGEREYPTKGMHRGVDIVPEDQSGSANVKSTIEGQVVSVERGVKDSDTAKESSDGKVEYSGKNKAGNFVWIKAKDDSVRIGSMHLKEGSIPSEIKVGANIKAGTTLGKMGSTGQSTGPHLHYQMEYMPEGSTDWVSTNPLEGSNSTSSSSSSTSSSSSSSVATISNSSNTALAGQEISGTEQDAISTDAPSSPLDGETATAQTGAGGGILSQLVGNLKDIGNAFLSVVTGGLIGSLPTQDTSSSSGGSGSSSAGSGSEEFLSSVQNGTGSVQAFLDMCQKEVGTKENPPGSNKVKYNQWFYGSNTGAAWCMAFVQWCFNNAGLTLPYKTARCSDLLKWYKDNDPGRCRTTPEPGDIFFKNASGDSHTGIVKAVNGSSFTTIEGNAGSNTDAVVNGNHPISYAKGGFVHPVDWESIDNAASSSLSDSSSDSGSGGNIQVSGEGKEAIWNYLKDMGLDDYAVAGIMGNWEQESGNNPAILEGAVGETGIKHWKECVGDDYLDKYQTNRKGVNAYFNKYLRPSLEKLEAKGNKIHWDFYLPGGNAYPGIGLSGWTGTNAMSLIEYANKQGSKWYDLDTQLGYFKSTFGSKADKVNGKSSPEEAAEAFQKSYQLATLAMDKRKGNAKAIYNQFAGKGGSTSKASTKGSTSSSAKSANRNTALAAVGGPDGVISIRTRIPQFGMGGPGETDGAPTVGSSSLGSSNYTTKKAPSKNLTKASAASSVFGVTRGQSVSYPKTNASSYAAAASSNDSSSGSGDMSQVIDYLNQIIEVLGQISSTGEAGNDILSSIESKDFQDTGLRNSIDSLKNAKPKKHNFNKQSKTSSSTARSVTSMARG